MPILDEIARTASEMRKAGALLAGTQAIARVAMIYAQDSRWAIEQQRFARDYDFVETMKSWYRPFYDRGITVDVVAPDQDLRGYAIVLAPGLNVVDRDTAKRLASYAHAGGHLVLGRR